MHRSWWLALLLSCAHTPPPPPPPPPAPPPPPPPAVQIPPGCERELGGEYLQRTLPGARWLATDDLDAGRLELVTRFDDRRDAGPAPRRFSRDGGLPWLVKGVDGGLRREDAPIEEPKQVRTTLVRTARGFVGNTQRAADGGCAFAIALVECRDDGVELETDAAKGPGCVDRPDAGRVRLSLRRANGAPSPSSDGGDATDAGTNEPAPPRDAGSAD